MRLNTFVYTERKRTTANSLDRINEIKIHPFRQKGIRLQLTV